MQVTIRLDDITPDMNWSRFRCFESVLDELGICPIIGVVPNCEDETLHIDNNNPDFWDEVRRLRDKGWVIAMHGYNHIYTTKKGGLFALNNFSEFAGVDYETQSDKIIKGKEIFKANGIESDIFMAPGHSFDKTTLKVLKEQGFKGITDGFNPNPYTRDGIVFYPIAFRRGRVFGRGKAGFSTLIYHLNTLPEDQLEKEIKILRANKSELVSFKPVTAAKRQSFVARIMEMSLVGIKKTLSAIRS